MPDAGSDRLADAVLAGETVDWARATAAGTPSIARGLSDIDRIARTARDALATAGHDAPRRPHVATRLLIGLAAFQIAGAALGYFERDWAVQAAASFATVSAFGVAALWLFIAGARDDRARWLAVFFCLVAAAFARQFLAPVASTPLRPLVNGIFPDAFVAYALWRFARRFPRITHFSSGDRWWAGFERAALGAGLILFAANLAAAYGAPVPSLLHRSHPRSAYWAIVVLLALPAIPAAAWRARLGARPERQRFALFALGLAAGIVPPLLELLAELGIPSFAAFMSSPGVREAAAPLFFIPMMTVPFSTAYAVLVEQVLDVRVVIGRALQLALTRTGVIAITSLPVLALATYGYRYRDLSLAALFSGRRGLVLLGLAATGGAALAARRGLLKLVDRKFLRGQADLARELESISAALRNTRSVGEVSALLEAELSRTLGVTHAALIPTEDAPGAIGALLDADHSPLPVGAESACLPLLPADDRHWIERHRAALLVPVSGEHDPRAGLLVVGAKHTGMPFTRDERSFVATVTAAAALALETRGRRDDAASAVASEPAEECSRCGSVRQFAEAVCKCGGTPRLAALPRLLAGKFQVEQRLGAGGMGVVYRARDLALSRAVALKTLPRLSRESAARLGKEAQLMAAVTHPHLALIYSIESWRRTPVMVVELLEGGTLASRALHREPIDRVVQLGIALAAALEALHANGVLHRDIKPSNIAFSPTGVPKLLDFGIASLIDAPAGPSASQEVAHVRATQTFTVGGHAVSGTPLYLSPEAARGDAPGPSFDLWSLAMVLYETIAGAHPFMGVSVSDVIRNVRLARVPDLREVRPECPERIAVTLSRMLARAPADRPASASAFRKSLEALADT